VRPGFRVALLAVLAGILSMAPAPSAADVEPYDIHTVLSLSGPATFVGKGIQESLGALEKIVNKQHGIGGRPVRFVYYDDQSSPQVSVQLVNQIIAKNVPVILGPSFSSTCHAAIPLVTNGPVLYCLSQGVIPAKSSYTFSAGVGTSDYLLRNMAYLRKRGWTRIAVLTTTDSTGQDADQNIDTSLARPENGALTIVAREHFNNTDISVAAQLARIKMANPQALIAWTTGPPIGTVFQALKTAGYDIPIFTSGGNESYPLMKQFEGILPKELYLAGTIYITGSTTKRTGPALQEFYDAYAALGSKPDQLSGDAWDPASILIDALRHTGPAPTAAQVHDYIEKLHGFRGIVGTYDFRDGSNRGIGFADIYQTRWDVAKSIWTLVE
jgi:branched-chain amino acid transport system substrate-binding protein